MVSWLVILDEEDVSRALEDGAEVTGKEEEGEGVGEMVSSSSAEVMGSLDDVVLITVD
jgi:hypothetical protein